MPLVRIAFAKHPDAGQKARIHARVTQVLVEEMGVSPDVVNVLLENVSPEDWAVGGTSLAEKFAAHARTAAATGGGR